MRRFTSFIYLAVIAMAVGFGVWQFLGKLNPTTTTPAPSTAIVTDNEPSPDAPAPEPTSSVVVPTTTAMQLSDPTQTKLPGTLVVDGSSTVNSADGAWSASMQMIKEYPITYGFNDGAGPNLVVDDAYLLITDMKTGVQKQIDVLNLAPDKMIAAAKNAPTVARYEYVTYDLTWSAGAAGDQLTGKAELYDTSKGTDAARLVQSATFTVNPKTWTVAKK